MSSGGAPRSLTDFLSRLGPRRQSDADPAASTPAGDREPVLGTKALRKFLSSLAVRDSPVLLDLGPVVGSNVNFFGTELGCKILVEDIFADIERHLQQGTTDTLATFLAGRFPESDGSVDGILCWDAFDYLERPAAQALAAGLTRVLRVDGALLGFFGTAASTDPRYTKYIIVDESNLRHRSYPATRGRQAVLQNRDIIKLFSGLRVSDSFLLQTNLREILFRKPEYLGSAKVNS